MIGRDMRTPASRPLSSKVASILESNIFLTLFLTSLGYAAAYIYFLGYFHTFELPSFLINLNPTALTLSILLTAGVGGSLLLAFIDYTNFDKRHRGKWWLLFVRTGIALIGFLYLLVAFDLLYIRFVLLLLSLILSIAALFYLVELVKIRNFKDAWIAFKNGSGRAIRESPFDHLPDNVPIYFITAVLVLSTAFFIGAFIARTQNTFLLTNSYGDIRELVIYVNEENVYAKAYNTKDKKFEDGFIKTNFKMNEKIKTFSLKENNSLDYFKH